MENLWICSNWTKYIRKKCKKGIGVSWERNINLDIRDECLEFIAWIKNKYKFPVRVHICLKNREVFYQKNGMPAYSSIWGPDDINEEPEIEIAVGGYSRLLKSKGKSKALMVIFSSIVHVLSHYFQWIKYHKEWADKKKEEYFDQQAKYYEKIIVSEYIGIYNIKSMGPLWICNEWARYIPVNCSTGIRISFEKNISIDLKNECIRFISWIKNEYKFPIKVYIYLKNQETFNWKNGTETHGSVV